MANPRNLFRQALSCVIRILQGPLTLDDRRLETRRLEDRKLAVIGGFCVQHYLGDERRETQDLDLMIEFDYPTDDIRVALANADPDHFRLRADVLYYCSGTDLVQVDLISHQTALPYHHRKIPDPPREVLPADATRIGDIQAEHPPFLSVQDMIALKVYCCGTRSTQRKNRVDAQDAWELAAVLPEVVTWEPWQRDAIQDGLEDVVCFFDETRNDWIAALRL
ncbi:uncharacterized protein CDV56_106837 [Aspergillus thermomutatus]|uniref:Uncharacterized protein n=1 Tax=Aspergillus thermomutatus TaxID=41047 RepID=A0A397GHS9_ASPTH|nr:uncharacterized protein CDV56_106837 [Aspergillus thermomutatus]RHZ50522.1 hypothetical protein CDV56_106837 [Aspergillus thermomutatus]